MITKVVIDDRECLSISMVGLNGKEDIELLKKALLDILSNIVCFEEPKNEVKASSMWWITELIATIDEDMKKL